MGATKEDIASQALGLLRANPISSFKEGTNEADIIDLYYNTFIQDVMSRYPWSFALVREQLTLDTEKPVNEFKNKFHKPRHALRVWALFNSDAIGARPITYNWFIQGHHILSDQTALWAQFTVYIDENDWPGFFITYAIHALAAYIALPITDDESIANRMHEIAYGTPSEGEEGGKFAVAKSIDSSQVLSTEIHDYELITARFS